MHQIILQLQRILHRDLMAFFLLENIQRIVYAGVSEFVECFFFFRFSFVLYFHVICNVTKTVILK